MTYSVTLTNPADWRLTLFVTPPIHEQPYETAERVANSDPEHARYAPWTAYRCDRWT